MKRIILAAAIAIAFTACTREPAQWDNQPSADGTTSGADPSTPLTPVQGSRSLAVVSAAVEGTTSEGASPGPSFPAVSTREINIRATVDGPPGSYLASIDFHLPSGGRFSQRRSTLVIDSSGQGSLEAVLPVAGTSIQNYGLKGNWEARIVIGAVSVAPLAVASFTLN